MYFAGLAIALAIVIDDVVTDNDRYRRGAVAESSRATAAVVLDSAGVSRRHLLIPTLIVVATAIPVLMLGGSRRGVLGPDGGVLPAGRRLLHGRGVDPRSCAETVARSAPSTCRWDGC